MVAMTPALAYVIGPGGNFASCIALPRKTVQKIYIQVGATQRKYTTLLSVNSKVKPKK
jgi:hypothetical protein